MRKRIAFIDHSYRQKTQSITDITNLLGKYFDLDFYWDHYWKKGPRVNLEEISKKDYDIIIFFQVLYPIPLLNLLDCKNIILIPMYDGVSKVNNYTWLSYGHFKIISFCKFLHLKLRTLNIASKYFQFFLNPSDYGSEQNDFNKLRGFFWQRMGDITWNSVRQLISNNEFEKVYVHKATDPPGYNFVMPNAKERKKYNIQIIDWFNSKNEYLNIFNDINVYFSPRIYEGIGLSFIEAMTMGKCVIGSNTPTINEYIKDGVTGFLYNHKNPKALDLSKAEKMAENARQYCREGYDNWLKAEDEFIGFIDSMTSYQLKTSKIPDIQKKDRSFFEEQIRGKDDIINYLNRIIMSQSMLLKEYSEELKGLRARNMGFLNKLKRFLVRNIHRLMKAIFSPFKTAKKN
jgi:glycosyltransferase involved in cell wall biosynthesis